MSEAHFGKKFDFESVNKSVKVSLLFWFDFWTKMIHTLLSLEIVDGLVLVCMYRTHAIVTWGLYDCYPNFHCGLYWRAVYIKEILHLFKPKIRGLYTRAVTDQEQVIVARLWYVLISVLSMWLPLSLVCFFEVNNV